MNDSFYDELAESYHLIFDDWDAAILRQRDVLARLLPVPANGKRVLDCACGIGTQVIGLAMLGFSVEGSDPSDASIKRARREATARGMKAEFRVDDMRSLSTAPIDSYDAIIAMDNAVPHLQSDDDITKALRTICARLRSGGIMLMSLRDYAPLMAQRTSSTPAALYSDGKFRRFVHQVWDWQDDRHYVVHLFITMQMPDGWHTRHFVGQYRAITPSDVAALAVHAGFDDVRVLAPDETDYYQPVIRAVAPAVSSSVSGRVSRAWPVHTVARNCTRDEGGPFGFGNQMLISSHCKLLRSKAVVVSVAVKSGQKLGQARSREASASEPLQKRRKRIRRCQNRGVTLPPGSARGMS